MGDQPPSACARSNPVAIVLGMYPKSGMLSTSVMRVTELRRQVDTWPWPVADCPVVKIESPRQPIGEGDEEIRDG